MTSCYSRTTRAPVWSLS